MSVDPMGNAASSAQSGPPPAIRHGRVVCLCAQWCDLCRDYRKLFDDAAARHPALEFRWIDIEDEADLTGDMEVETFPTLVIADNTGRLIFAGALAPQPGVLERLLVSAAESGHVRPVQDPEASALLARMVGNTVR